MPNAVKCKKCSNENLIHNLDLGKADAAFRVGGPGQDQPMMENAWKVYMCPSCNSVYPYERFYPAQPSLQQIKAQIIEWLETISQTKRDINEALEQIKSIISANKELVGLPGLQKDELVNEALTPVWEEIDKMWAELKRRRGGRPKGSTTKKVT